MKKSMYNSGTGKYLFLGLFFLSIIFVCQPCNQVKGNSLMYDLLSDDGGLVLATGGTLNNIGTMVILGNLINNGTPDLGTGTMKFSGSATQAVNGINTFGGIEVNNPTGITIDGPTVVNGSLTLTNGLVTLGENNLLLGAASCIGGTPDAGRMVVVTSSGQLRKKFSGNGSFTFPVGDNSGTAEFSPVTMNFTSGTYGADNWAGVNLVNSPYSGSTDSFLNRYWNLSSNGISGFSCNTNFTYASPVDVTGLEGDMFCVKTDPYEIYDPADPVLHRLTANGITSFGTFTGNLGTRTLNLTSIFLEGLYNGYGTMFQAQEAVWDEEGNIIGVEPRWTDGSADHITVELHSALWGYDPACDCDTSDYPTVLYATANVPLNPDGNATVKIPGSKNGSYYITIKHRNSIETTTAIPVSFSPGLLAYAFDDQSKAYEGNMTVVIESDQETLSPPLIFGGDVNQDGSIEAEDLNQVGNDAAVFTYGYLPTDVYSDATIEAQDLNITGNNAASFVYTHVPR